MTPLRLIFAGSGAFGVPTLRQLASQDRYEIVQVVTQPDRASGRGRQLAATPIGQLAAELHLPLLNTADIPGKRRAGSGAWAGIFNTHFWIDPTTGIAGAIYTQTLPFVEPSVFQVYADFEAALYASL